MAQRFCSRCNAQVEDTGGYCLLGHDLRLEAPVDSLKALRAEVNRTFDEARRELADVMAPAATFAPELGDAGGAPRADLQVPAAPRKNGSVRLDEALVVEGHPGDDDREWSDARAAEDPAPSPAPSPPPPPDAHPTGGEGLDEAPGLTPGDPITTFAPSPRMDWGPRRSRFGRRASTDEQHADA